MEMKLWRTNEAQVQDALRKDIAKHGQSSRFMSLADDRFGLRLCNEQTTKPTEPSLVSVEADLFGTILGFHKKIMTLLRQSSLDDQKMKIVADRIKTLLDGATAELEGTEWLKLTERLEAAYDETKRLLDELSVLPDGGKDS